MLDDFDPIDMPSFDFIDDGYDGPPPPTWVIVLLIIAAIVVVFLIS